MVDGSNAGPQVLRMVKPDDIKVPDLRATAQYDAELETELEESIASQGILQPMQLEEVDGELWLVDGLHRLIAAKRLGLAEVPCLVRPGDHAGVMVKNLITSRQKGKSNPGEEAKLVRYLREEGNMPLERIAELTGLSIGWTRKLHDVAYLPDPVLNLVSLGKLGISHALELVRLEDTALQLEVASQAVEWHYTVEQIRLRVNTLLEPVQEPVPGSVQFGAQGRPSRVPIPCYVCHTDLTGNVNYIYICGDCQQLVDTFLQAYHAPQQAPPPQGAPAPVPAKQTEHAAS